jgi:hypothetical protein
MDIRLLHDKLDRLREQQWVELLAIEKEQLAILSSLAQKEVGPS